MGYRAIYKHVYDINKSLVVGENIEEAIELYRKLYPYETIEEVSLIKPTNIYGGSGFAIVDAEPLEMNQN